ncbi:hypothetical protein J3R30DRAFT_3693990 [Lentinula aciculospora]|uniref:Uncharacterized protein n=1 Tax=Lentinula aciculospora TaxID=153920 RepID=A0A9W9ATT8_9AGAR|nr:hypothetical protein J3R30DRAFT_3693990 [Lentinula aciculospora]
MLSSSSVQLLAEVTVKLYHANISGTEYEWRYFNQRGTAQFCQHQHVEAEAEHPTAEEKEISPEFTETTYWFRLRDETTGRILWTFSIPEDCSYRIDKPFFHVFNGRSRMWGFLFNRDEDAQAFGQVVQTQLPNTAQQDLQPKVQRSGTKYSRRAPSVRSENISKSRIGRLRVSNTSTPTLASPQRITSDLKPRQQITGLTTSIISLPQTNSFVHVGHIGLGGDGVIECSEGIDPSWSSVITDLQHGNLAADEFRRKELINSFRLGMKKLGPASMRAGCF